MKSLNEFITEKFKFGKNKIQKYSCQPKNYKELREIIEKRLEQDKDADLNDIDISQIEDMSNLFMGLDPHNIDISEWDVSNVWNMRYMFFECKNFEGKGLENWNVSKVSHMGAMFQRCLNFEGKEVENWNVEKCESMGSMFRECIKFNADLGNWNVSKVKNMSYMFEKCENFEGKGLENWDVSSIQTDHCIFFRCQKLKKPKWYKEV